MFYYSKTTFIKLINTRAFLTVLIGKLVSHNPFQECSLINLQKLCGVTKNGHPYCIKVTYSLCSETQQAPCFNDLKEERGLFCSLPTDFNRINTINKNIPSFKMEYIHSTHRKRSGPCKQKKSCLIPEQCSTKSLFFIL